MAKNSVDSTVTLVLPESPVRLEGEFVSATDKFITFKAKRRGGQRFTQRSFSRNKVLSYGPDFAVVLLTAAVHRQIFRPIAGQVETDPKSGWYVVDGVTINPEYATVEADLGVPGGAAKKEAPAKKKVKKAA